MDKERLEIETQALEVQKLEQLEQLARELEVAVRFGEWEGLPEALELVNQIKVLDIKSLDHDKTYLMIAGIYSILGFWFLCNALVAQMVNKEPINLTAFVYYSAVIVCCVSSMRSYDLYSDQIRKEDKDISVLPRELLTSLRSVSKVSRRLKWFDYELFCQAVVVCQENLMRRESGFEQIPGTFDLSFVPPSKIFHTNN